MTVKLESVADLVGNFNEDGFSWTFVVEEAACGRSEFLGDLTAAPLVLSSASSLAAGVPVSIYNPDQSIQAWVDNLRINSIALVYRKARSAQWIPALNMQGNPALFFDDVRHLPDLCFDAMYPHFLLPVFCTGCLRCGDSGMECSWAC